MHNELIKRILSSVFLIPVILFFIIEGAYLFNIFILVCLIISIYEWNKMNKNAGYKIAGILFLIFSFYSAYYLRFKIDDDYLHFIMILFICIFTDTGGYVFGKIFKGPRLTKISPNKTYAGVFGGYLFSIIFIIIFFKYFNEKELSIYNIFFTVVISTISQIGDIFISYFKRKSKIKNTGKIIPGHGGLLDRIDGVIFAFPASYLIFKLFY